MSTFVIVHGAWGGGWEWTPLARLLRARGHDAFTCTLTGMGERAHLGWHGTVDLETHIDDLVAVLELEDLRDVVLVAGSYGGMPATGAADRASDRLRLLIYVDALVPRDGQSALDLLPVPFAEMVRGGVAEHGPRWRVPLPPELFDALFPEGSLPDEVRTTYWARTRDHPASSFTQPVRLMGAVDALPRAFIRCTAAEFADELGGDPVVASAQRAVDEGWPYRELAAPHDPNIYHPVGLVDLLEDLTR